jgi:phosphohistidine phosphatase
MELILWRHADAEDGAPDLRRELTALGRKQAAHVADWLNVRLPTHCRLLCSPAVRAQQTLDALERDYEVDPTLAPGGEPGAILRAAGWPDYHGTVLVASHQPALGHLAALLLSGRAQDWDVPRAALWWFEQRAPYTPWNLTLRAVITPEMLLK